MRFICRPWKHKRLQARMQQGCSMINGAIQSRDSTEIVESLVMDGGAMD